MRGCFCTTWHREAEQTVCSQAAPGFQETRDRKWPRPPAYHSKPTYQIKSLLPWGGGSEWFRRPESAYWSSVHMEECSWMGKTAHLTHPQQMEGQRLYNTWANPPSFIAGFPVTLKAHRAALLQPQLRPCAC